MGSSERFVCRSGVEIYLEDQYAPPDLVTDFVRQLPDAGQTVVPDCGDFPFLEQPDAFTAALRPFLERVW